VLATADLVMAVGTSLSGQDTAQFALSLPQCLVHIDIDPSNIDLNYPAQMAIIGDATRVLNELNKQLASTGVDRSGEFPVWASRVAALKKEAEQALRQRPD